MVVPMPDVYESPDGGKTIYARSMGTTARRLVQGATGENDSRRELQLQVMWHGIHSAAQHDPVLNDMLEQIEVYYQLRHANIDHHSV